MRTLLIFILISVSACAKRGDEAQATAVPSEAAPIDKTCKVVDACTYSGVFVRTPMYNCIAATYYADEHPELASYFSGKTCLTTREDYRTMSAPCGPSNMFWCSLDVQGPGPSAL